MKQGTQSEALKPSNSEENVYLKVSKLSSIGYYPPLSNIEDKTCWEWNA